MFGDLQVVLRGPVQWQRRAAQRAGPEPGFVPPSVTQTWPGDAEAECQGSARPVRGSVLGASEDSLSAGLGAPLLGVNWEP